MDRMRTFKITMNERQRDGSIRTIEQTAVCESAQDAVRLYGLEEPDIVYYTIEEQ